MTHLSSTATATVGALWWTAIAEDAERFIVDDRARLLNVPDANIQVGVAPDGLPLVMQVRRSASVVEPLLRAVGAQNLARVSPEVRRLVTALDRLVQDERRTRGIYTDSHNAPHYLTSTTIERLLGNTLLSRLLGNKSPLLWSVDNSFAARDAAVKTSVGALASPQEWAAIKRAAESVQHLVVPLDENAPCRVVRRAPAEALTAVALDDARTALWEDLRGFGGAQFHTYRRQKGRDEVEHHHGFLDDNDAYVDALESADNVAWSVSNDELAKGVIAAARSLRSLHDAGVIHGDLKPANLLVTAAGCVAHDSLDIPVGTLAAMGTKGWNAPEQTMARPVSRATDVFALAQLLVLLLDAAVFGDERAFVCPIGGRERIRETFIAEPDVFIDPSCMPLAAPLREGWRALLRRCLMLDPTKRPPNASAFADEAEALLARGPLPGRRAMPGLIGRLRVRRGGTREMRAVWVVDG